MNRSRDGVLSPNSRKSFPANSRSIAMSGYRCHSSVSTLRPRAERSGNPTNCHSGRVRTSTKTVSAEDSRTRHASSGEISEMSSADSPITVCPPQGDSDPPEMVTTATGAVQSDFAFRTALISTRSNIELCLNVIFLVKILSHLIRGSADSGQTHVPLLCPSGTAVSQVPDANGTRIHGVMQHHSRAITQAKRQ